MHSFESFDQDHLPPKEAFYSKLHECDISDEDEAHAQMVWKTFKIRNMGEYLELYLKRMFLSRPIDIT